MPIRDKGDSMNEYTKLGALVNQQFTITKVWGFKWKYWSAQENKMLVSDTWEKGYQKKYQVDTDKGKLELSSSQVGQLLEGVFKDGVADVNNQTFSVKSNGKTGLEVRYFLNPAKREEVKSIQDPDVKAKLIEKAVDAMPPVENYNDLGDDPVDLGSIPF